MVRFGRQKPVTTASASSIPKPHGCRHDGGRRGRGQRQHALGVELARPLGELEVVGPEVVPPLEMQCASSTATARSAPSELREEALVAEPPGAT
jgi:hypothetical protein